MYTQYYKQHGMAEGPLENQDYRKAAKRILPNRYILANIFKHLVAEVRDRSIEEILSFLDGSLTVLADDDLHYHMEFCMYAGEDGSYRIATMPDGSRLEKVYSVWVCLDPSGETRNAISEFFFNQRDILGHIPCQQEDYDKLRVIQICLQPDTPGTEHPVIRFLNTLFGGKSREEIEAILEQEFQIPPEEGIGKQAVELGSLQRLKERQGIRLGTLRTIRRALDNGMEEAAVKRYLNATDDLIEKAKSLVLKA